MAGKVWHGGAGSGEFMHGVAGMAGSVVFGAFCFGALTCVLEWRGRSGQDRWGKFLRVVAWCVKAGEVCSGEERSVRVRTGMSWQEWFCLVW